MPRSRSKTTLTVEFGRRVRERRHALLMTQEQLSFLSGFHVTWISSLENGERSPSLVNIVRLAEHLGIDPGQLVEGLRTDSPMT